VKTGSRYENSKTLGFAHFLEHMLFEGTKKMETSRELSEYLENIGGVGGAFTEKEYITYYVKVLPISFQIGMSYILDILFNSALPQTAIEIEKGIVTEEIYRKSDNPEVEIWDLWLSWVFGEKSGIGQPTLGTVDQLSHINQSALKKYMSN
jgi:predicted Zn-dependent peptidase